MNQKSYVLLVSFDPQDIPITSKFFLGTSSETLRKNSPAQPQSKTAFRKNSSSIRENFVLVTFQKLLDAQVRCKNLNL